MSVIIQSAAFAGLVLAASLAATLGADAATMTPATLAKTMKPVGQVALAAEHRHWRTSGVAHDISMRHGTFMLKGHRYTAADRHMLRGLRQDHAVTVTYHWSHGHRIADHVEPARA